MIDRFKYYTIQEATKLLYPITEDQLYTAYKNKTILGREFPEEPNTIFILGIYLMKFRDSDDFKEITKPISIEMTGTDAVTVVIPSVIKQYPLTFIDAVDGVRTTLTETHSHGSANRRPTALIIEVWEDNINVDNNVPIELYSEFLRNQGY